MIKDRILSGAIAGAAGAVAQNIYIILARFFGVIEPSYIDYGKSVLFFKNYHGMLANSFGLIGHFIWDILLGIIFAFFLSNTSSRYHLLKGLMYGAFAWFIVKFVANLIRLPIEAGIPPRSILFFFLGSLLFGLTAAYTLRLLERAKVKL